eukprot:TRINITY_DN53766_c0_g2_i1.p1 TRINITY_DN53766_c0_g2~~TRINITY_DN53766_c0_g2_i1.p1  ORF type:complete len:150 (+),score=11.90 TRINITY_DN53766_c0_g2_i1:70-519(+)
MLDHLMRSTMLARTALERVRSSGGRRAAASSAAASSWFGLQMGICGMLECACLEYSCQETRMMLLGYDAALCLACVLDLAVPGKRACHFVALRLGFLKSSLAPIRSAFLWRQEAGFLALLAIYRTSQVSLSSAQGRALGTMLNIGPAPT